MEAEDFKERCSNLFYFFDDEKEDFKDSEDGLHDIKLLNFVRHLLPDTYKGLSTYFQDHNDKVGDQFIEDLFEDFWGNLAMYSFALGFAFGNLIEPTDPAVLNDLDLIKKEIREKQLLPYLPREKKGGSHD